MATKILAFDLSAGPRTLTGLAPYTHALILLRWGRRTLGRIRLEVDGDRIEAADLWWAASAAVGNDVVAPAVSDIIDAERTSRSDASQLPTVSIVVCTRDRTDELRRCLDALCSSAVAGSEVEVIVVDNAPSDEGTAELAKSYPVRYALEPRQGLNWARSRGAALSQGDIVAYIDDDVVVEPDWLEPMRRAFLDPTAAAVTGLVMPLELENEAQEQFEKYCSFIRGLARREFSLNVMSPLAAGSIGAGACMALRRALVNDLGLFAVELDAGTATRTGGDTYAFYRLLSLGYRIVFDPDVVVWHRHRRDQHNLRDTLYGYSVGTYAYFMRCLLHHGESLAVYSGLWWFWNHHLRQLWRGALGQPDAQPLALTVAEIRGCFAAPFAYLESRRIERAKLAQAPGS